MQQKKAPKTQQQSQRSNYGPQKQQTPATKQPPIRYGQQKQNGSKPATPAWRGNKLPPPGTSYYGPSVAATPPRLLPGQKPPLPPGPPPGHSSKPLVQSQREKPSHKQTIIAHRDLPDAQHPAPGSIDRKSTCLNSSH